MSRLSKLILTEGIVGRLSSHLSKLILILAVAANLQKVKAPV
jgi:hypothetical protein